MTPHDFRDYVEPRGGRDVLQFDRIAAQVTPSPQTAAPPQHVKLQSARHDQLVKPAPSCTKTLIYPAVGQHVPNNPLCRSLSARAEPTLPQPSAAAEQRVNSQRQTSAV